MQPADGAGFLFYSRRRVCSVPAYRLLSPQTLKAKLFFSIGALALLIGILSMVPITLTLNYERKEEIISNLSKTI
ncbi:hypothetical protein, partial [Acinetobacter baumannii]|uniref:hypothetical protein n=1 Tax=Acinetobacter baumannii TaxID=470 RepID=UPI00129E87B9